MNQRLNVKSQTMQVLEEHIGVRKVSNYDLISKC